MDRFLLAENPMHSEPHRLFVLHTVYPRCLIECICLNDFDADDDLSAIFDFYQHSISVDGVILPEKWQLIIRQYYDHEDVDAVPDDIVPKYRKVLNKAWHWYKAYLEFEDAGIDDENNANLN